MPAAAKSRPLSRVRGLGGRDAEELSARGQLDDHLNRFDSIDELERDVGVA
jgi:hypothetical protein